MIGYTPFMATNGTVWISVACDQGSYLTGLTLNATFPEQLTCNGYRVFVASFPGYIGSTRNGQHLSLPIDQSIVYRTTLNGNACEVLTGTVSGGPCAGHVFFSVLTNIADDQLGCFGRGVATFTVNYAYVQVFGHKCRSVCQSKVNGFLSVDPPISNKGKYVQG